jgi:hypothetical protein
MVKIITGVPKLPGEKILDTGKKILDKVDTVDRVTRSVSRSGLFDFLTERERTKQEKEKTKRFKEFAEVKKEEIRSWKEIELARIKAESEANKLEIEKLREKIKGLIKLYEGISPEKRAELTGNIIKTIAEL